MEELCGPPYLHSPFHHSLSLLHLLSSISLLSTIPSMEETRSYKTRLEIKGILKQKVVTSVDTEEVELGFGEDDKKRKTLITRSGSSSVNGVGSSSCCQAEKCTADLSVAKRYHRRHKVCEFHSKSPVVIVAGLRQRFCQQCSRFHELLEFDETKRSCRSRLAGHNERRRKSLSESHGEGSSSKGLNPELKENHCRQANQRGTRITFTAGDTKHFQIS